MRKLKKLGLLPASLLGLLLSLAVTALFCLPFAAVICRGLLPMETMGLWALLAAGLGVMAGTVCVVRLRGRQVMPTAGIVGGGFLLTASLLCAAGGARSDFGPWLFWLAAAVLAGGLLGAVMSIRQNTHKKHRR